MRVDCEGEDCHTSIEISDIINKTSMEEFKQALQELDEAGWAYVQDPKSIYFFCPEHKSLAIAGQTLIDALNKPPEDHGTAPSA